MMTDTKWFMVSIFALQATGALWFAHVTTCCETQNRAACCESASCDECDGVHFAPAGPCHHASQACDICKTLLTLRVMAVVEPALPAATGVCHLLPPAVNQSLPTGVFSIVDARGPPAIIL